MKKRTGTVEVLLKSQRGLGSAGDGCGGYYRFCETGISPNACDKSTREINEPSLAEMIARALGRLPSVDGSIVKVTVTVAVVTEPAESKKLCHNEWPGHIVVCPYRTYRDAEVKVRK